MVNVVNEKIFLNECLLYCRLLPELHVKSIESIAVNIDVFVVQVMLAVSL